MSGAEVTKPVIPDEVLEHFRKGDLVAAIAQDVSDGQVLMVAWMNEAALRETIASGQATYWSRSRQNIWRKGETSGHFQQVHTLRYDCDGDAILMEVEQTGAACHTGARSCFYRSIPVIEISSSKGSASE
jgi:phosphoribosyl-AMP cyclohydrolase